MQSSQTVGFHTWYLLALSAMLATAHSKGAIVMYAYYPEGTSAPSNLPTLSIANKRAFAERANIDIVVERKQILPAEYSPAWAKLKVVRKVLETHEWALWLDLDSYIMNFTVDPESVCIADFNIAKDHFGVNSGVFCVRNTDWGKRFMEDALDLWPKLKTHGWNEQGAIIELLKNPDAEQHVYYPPQKEMNAYPAYTCSRGQCYAWQKGDFIIHYPGGRKSDWDRTIRELEAEIVGRE